VRAKALIRHLSGFTDRQIADLCTVILERHLSDPG
jgi:hypothetical protein